MPNLDKYSAKLLPIAELAHTAGLSLAFVEYAIDAGCPTVKGRLSHRMLVEWLVEFLRDDLRNLRELEIQAA